MTWTPSEARRLRDLMNDVAATYGVVATPTVLQRRRVLQAKVDRLRGEGVPILSPEELRSLPK